MSAPDPDNPQDDRESEADSGELASDPDLTWLSARERGESHLPPLDPRRAVAYEKLQALISALPDEQVPDAWNDEVLAAIRAAQQPEPLAMSAAATLLPEAPASAPRSHADRRRARLDRDNHAPHTRGWQLAAAAVVAVAAVLALWLATRFTPDLVDDSANPGRHGLVVSVVHHDGKRAGIVEGEAALGDVLVIEARTAEVDELRIYRDDQEIVLGCPGPGTPSSEACEHKPGALVARLRITAPGRYRAVGLHPAPIRPPSGNLSADVADCNCQSYTATPVVAR
jgi:hypothetical protein